MRRTVPLALAAALLASSCGAGDRDPPGWTRLENGLRVCVKQVDGATNVAVLTVFDVGSDHDPVGQSGLAHLVEHLYVTSAAGGTKARTSSEWFAAHPDGCSAATSGTITHVVTVVAPDALDDELADAAARMSELRIETTDLDRERASVLTQVAEENVDVTAVARARRAALARLRPVPGAGSGVGVKEELDKLTLDDVSVRTRSLYKPANARLVVAGAVDEAAARAFVEKRFAGIARGERVRDPAPLGPSRAETVELPDEPSIKLGAQRERAVCVAYPASLSSAGDVASGVVLMSRASPSPVLYAVASENAVTFVRVAGEGSIDDDVRRIDALVAGLAKDAPTAAETDWVRKASTASAIGGAVKDADPKQRAALAAGRLAAEAREPYDFDDVLRAVESLTQADLARYAATQFDPAKRVVVVAWGAKRPPPVHAPMTAEELRDLRDRGLVSEIRVVMTWDETTQTIRRKIGDREFPDDGELQKAIAEAHDAWVKKGKPDAPVTIDADARIPWKDVVNVVNIIKRCDIQKIEFAMGAPPKKPAPK